MQVSDEVSGSIIEALSVRKGELREMVTLQVGETTNRSWGS